jgi:hypothetical protein
MQQAPRSSHAKGAWGFTMRRKVRLTRGEGTPARRGSECIQCACERRGSLGMRGRPRLAAPRMLGCRCNMASSHPKAAACLGARHVLEVQCMPHGTDTSAARLHVAAHDQQVAGAQRRAPFHSGVRVPAQHKVALRAKGSGPCATQCHNRLTAHWCDVHVCLNSKAPCPGGGKSRDRTDTV